MASFPASPPPSPEHMLGHGFYNKHSHEQGAANRYGLNLIEQAISRIDLAQVGDTFRAADYGSAQGRNSLLPLTTALAALQPQPSSVSVTHTDLPTNDWTSLFQTVLFSPESYVHAAQDVFVFASGTSIYEQIFPAGEIAFGYSAIATHWMSRKPSNIPNQIWSARTAGQTRAVWAKQARDDWYDFLRFRAVEMIPSGQLVMVNSGADKNGNSGAEPLIDLVNQVLQEMVKLGSLGADEYADMAIPTYYRTEAEWREPFNDPGFLKKNPLQLLHYEELALEDVNLNQYDQTHDESAFAQSDAAFFNAAFEPALFANLRSDRSAASRQQVIDQFSQKLQNALAKNPSAYPARWVLQLIWVSKT